MMELGFWELVFPFKKFETVCSLVNETGELEIVKVKVSWRMLFGKMIRVKSEVIK